MYEAARAVEDELSWAAGATLQRGCIESSAPPLVVTLEYMHRNDGLRYAQAYWPWHTSDWRVRDDAAARLTIETMRGVRSGLAPSQALQQAQLALMADTSVPGSAHPATWAPFVIIGE